ncbi:hypothetical protein DXH95_13675 [Sphingorhabdus pulchriflava]|uniref:Uncharacterized protein n=1 Tax=Sphingorhabdus pulchriflava TaxID=2292257 RepID=A0A371B5V0_9SPHN|nr:hypothetical protein [Sphingorhabdus pulchriflava]RDV02958.1 hypothetical protein DXH95_13675 [Sphingorhabdus pulchriflava]
MRDSAYLIEKIFQEIEKLVLLSYESEEEMRRSCFEIMINDYEGFDIVEVICREAAYISVYENLESVFRQEIGYFRH